MNVNLSDDLCAYVAQELADGGYTNQSEVVREALRLLRSRNGSLRELRSAVAHGAADAQAKREVPFTRTILEDAWQAGKQRADEELSG